MTPKQIELIQQSFAKVSPISDKAAAMFYDRLFEIAPDTKSLFRGDMAGQGRKLMATLAVVVSGLANLDAILPAASALAKRHVGYGVMASHYTPVGRSGHWRKASARHGRPSSRLHGPLRTRPCRAS